MKQAPQQVHNAGQNVNVFEHKEYDVTDCCSSIFCSSMKLILEPEYVVVEVKTPCATNRARTPYGEYNVDLQTSCGCCIAVNGMSPGCGCDKIAVTEVATELQRRVGSRGITGQIQKAEHTAELIDQLHKKVDNLERKMDLILQKMDR